VNTCVSHKEPGKQHHNWDPPAVFSLNLQFTAVWKC